jgi:hypothetical protein
MSETAAVNPEEYNSFIQGLRLENIYLVAANTRVLRFPETTSLHFSIEETSEGPSVADSPNSRNQEQELISFQAATKYVITLFEEAPPRPGVEEEKPEPFAVLEVVWAAVYGCERLPTEDEFGVFVQQNLPLNLWPYLRQFVHTTLAQMSLPVLLLPPFKL